MIGEILSVFSFFLRQKTKSATRTIIIHKYARAASLPTHGSVTILELLEGPATAKLETEPLVIPN